MSRLMGFFAMAAVALASGLATAATITVTSLLDNNVGCTLRNAIASSNTGTSQGGCTAGGASNTIVFAVNGTIALSGPPLNIIRNSLTIAGNGATATIIDAQDLDHAFDNFDAAPVALSIAWRNLAIRRGNALATGPGAFSSAGAIFVDTLTTASLANCVVNANKAQSSGGAIENRGTLTIANCTFDGNLAAGQGGAIRNIGTLSIAGSTFRNNSSNSGGAIWHSSGTAARALAIVNSTFVGNAATTFGGAIAADDTTSAGGVTLTHATLTGNTAATGGGIYTNNGAAFSVDRAILGANTASSSGPDCATAAGKSLASLNYNVFGTLAGCTVTGTISNNVVTPTLNLGALAGNGGPTQTVALLAGSPAIDIAPTCSSDVDQRGLARPVGPSCDAGAFERQAALALTPASLPAGQVGVTYSQDLTALNGTGPYTFAVTTGAPPPGLALSASGLVSGTPGSAGSFSFTVTVTDTFSGATGAFPYTVGITATSAGLFRSYVSRNGNDANPCTLPAPCRLLPAALVAVKDGGEIWILDSGNFNSGVVLIGKSVTIQAVPGAYGSVVANNADAINVNAAAVEVALKGIAVLNLAGTANTGIRFTQGAQLTLEDTQVFGMATGILATAPNGLLAVVDSTIRDNTGQGLSLQGSLRATIDRTAFIGNGSAGLVAQGGAMARVTASSISGSTTGATAAAAGGTSTQLTLSGSELSGNGTAVSVAAAAGGDLAQVLLDDLTITHNTTGVALSGSGTRTAFTRQNNAFRFNAMDVAGALTPLPAK